MTTSKNNQATKSLEKLLITSVIESLYQNGSLTDEEISNKTKTWAKLEELIKGGNLDLIIEHRESIIQSARHYKKLKDRNNSLLFYAMFFEHTLNSIIERVCSKRKIDRKTTTEIIKSVSIHGKTSWLLTLMDLPKLNDIHRTRIMKVTEERNSYVHYKFTPAPDEPDEKEELTDKYLNEIEKTITYLKSFESKIIFNNKKGHFKKHLKI